MFATFEEFGNFHNFLVGSEKGWQHLVHTAVLHLESNLKRARGRQEERGCLVIKVCRMASVCSTHGTELMPLNGEPSALSPSQNSF